MTISSVSRSSGSGTVHSHRHTKSSSAIGSIALPVQHASSPARAQLHHAAPTPRAVEHNPTPRTPKSEPSALRKKRRQRKPKDLSKSIIEQTTTATTATLHDSPPPAAFLAGAAAAAAPMPPPPFSKTRSIPEQLKTPTKPQASSSSAALDSPGKAYAGPGFHHSPAPSSLPVPKFFSKSVPVRGSSPGLRALLGDADSTDGSQSSSPPLSPPPLSAAETPLEKLFKADREEKARRRKRQSESSDTDSTDRDIFDMDPGSPVRPAAPASTTTTNTTTTTTTTTATTFSMDSLTGSLPATPDRQATGAALRQFLLQQPGVLPPTTTGSSNNPPSPSPAASRPHFFVSPQGSPLARQPPATRPSLGRLPLLPLQPHHRRHHPLPPPPPSHPPPKAPQFLPALHQHPPSRPFGAENTPPSSRPSLSSPRRDSSIACKAESHDVMHMENSLRRILKLDPRPTLAGGVLI